MKEVKIGERRKWESLISEEDSVLDIGCWSGEKVLELSKKTKNAYGMDIDSSKLKFANPKIKNKLKKGDITKKVPFSRKFDWIILGEVLEHVSDDEIALKNISKSLKGGGKLILSTPRSVKFFEFWDPAWFRWKFLNGQKHYHYTKKDLFGKLRKQDLEVKEYYIQYNISWCFFRWLNVFINYILRINKKIYPKRERKGSFDWVILAEKIK
jgi:SAM-dependent methyltransferase